MPKYQVIVESSPEALRECVESMIAEGWGCQGGVSVLIQTLNRPGLERFDSAKTVYVFAQAMTKDEA